MRDLRRVLQRTRQGLKGQFARRHMQELLGPTVTRPARPVRSRAPRPVAVTI
jgi:hypothetical protein